MSSPMQDKLAAKDAMIRARDKQIKALRDALREAIGLAKIIREDPDVRYPSPVYQAALDRLDDILSKAALRGEEVSGGS